MKLASLLQLVGKSVQAGKIDSLKQVRNIKAQTTALNRAKKICFVQLCYGSI